MQKAPNTFQNTSVPRAYVAGLGRGANAFQTSAQTGVVSVPSFGAAPAGYVPGSGRGIGGFGETKPGAAPGGLSGGGATTGGRFDRMLGYEGSLFSSGEYGSEDQYADAVYAQVDEARKRKEKRPIASAAAAPVGGGLTGGKAIADNFADLKTKLKQVSVDEWGSLPEAHSKVKNYKKTNKQERFTPVTDSMLATAAAMATSGSKREDLTGLSQARDQMLRVNLDRAGDSVLGQTVVDPRGVLTALSGEMDAAAQLGDVKKARLLLKSVTSTNPLHGPGWIAAARVEELAGRVTAAREIMDKARDACSDQEDVWLESARIETPERAKEVLAQAVSRYLPQSVTIWLAAADLEITEAEAIQEGVARKDAVGTWKRSPSSDADALQSDGKKQEHRGGARRELMELRVSKRKTILIHALEKIPDSVKLWSHAYMMETNNDKARELLLRASMCCPHSVDFYISMARLETSPEAAQKCLNDARKKFPGEIRIWIAAVRLVEETTTANAAEAAVKIQNILSKALEKIAAHVDRSIWLKQAEECEEESFPATAEAIIRTCLGLTIEAQDRQRTWLADASSFERKNRLLCARCCFELLLSEYPDDEDIWLERIAFERRQQQQQQTASISSSNMIKQVLALACSQVPTSQLLWLMYAKEVWVSGDLSQARRILEEAFEKLRDSAGDEMWFAAAKLAQEVSLEEAREVFRKAREMCPDSERVWVKSIVFERKVTPSTASQEETLAREALSRFPSNEKLWLMLGQVLEFKHPQALSEAKQVYQQGITACSGNKTGPVRLWLASARVEEQLVTNKVTARAILANARSKFQNHPEVWLASIRLERRANEPDSVIDSLLARGLQAIPNDGLLLSEQIEIAPEAKKEFFAKEAFEKTQGKDSKVILAVARVWWRKRPLDTKKVKKWLERAVSLTPKFGDAWAAMYRFHKDLIRSGEGGTSKQENEAMLQDVVTRCNQATPTHGERWISISKQRGNEDLKTDEILVRVAAFSGPDDYTV